MRLVEQHIIEKNDSRYGVIDAAAFAAKNLYNQATYQIRQAYIHEGQSLPYAELFHRVKHLECYQALPRKVSNSILIQIDKTWKAFREGFKEWDEHPEKFRGKPKIPGYKHKEQGRYLLIYDIQAIGKRAYKKTQYYNKQRAHHQKHLAKQQCFTSRKLDHLTTKRNRRINAYLHTASRRIIDLLVSEGIGTLCIGKNPLWKQEVEMGKKNNQQFVQMPHARFIEMVQYKGASVSIEVMTHEESYTSKASFLDLDDIPTYDPKQTEPPTFSGKRIARSWYQAGNGQVIHADVNGSYNIGRKVAPTAFGRGVAGAAVRPRRLAV